MRSASIALVGAFALIGATAANAAPAGPNLGVHNPNLVPAVAGCKLGFHPAYYGCAPNRYTYRLRRPYYDRDYVEEWDEYTYY